MNSSSVAAFEAITSPVKPEDPAGRCELLGPFGTSPYLAPRKSNPSNAPTALFVQGALGALALLVLLWKRSREHPQRPMLIWYPPFLPAPDMSTANAPRFMDASKQVIGGVLVHIANLLLSMLSSGTFSTDPSPTTGLDLAIPTPRRLFLRQFSDGDDVPPPPPDYHSNPCSFYLLNLGIDTTAGVVILIYALRLLNRLLELCPISYLRTGIDSGYYGDPPRWTFWMKQAAIYFTGLMIMKSIVWLIFALFPWLGMVGDYLLRWTEDNRKLQVFFVMFVSLPPRTCGCAPC